MKLDAFKKIIRECVKEAVREEVGLILLEQKQQQLNENMSFTTNDVDKIGLRKSLAKNLGLETPKMQQPKNIHPALKDNPYAAFIQDAGDSMSPQERRSIANPSSF